MNADTDLSAAPRGPSSSAGLTDADLLALVRIEASKFGRCCDQYQDGLGTFCCHECGQRTMVMLGSVQRLLGIRKDGEAIDCEAETRAAHEAAIRVNRAVNAHAELVEALTPFAALAVLRGRDDRSNDTRVVVNWNVTLGDLRRARAALSKATAPSQEGS